MGKFDQFMDEAQAAPAANLNLRFGVESSPDEAAEATKLARRYKLPVGLVSEFRGEYKQQAQLDDARAAVDKSPKLKGWLAYDDNNAKISHDDVHALSSIEGKVRELDQWRVSKPPTLTALASGIFSALPQGWRAAKAGIDLQVNDLFTALGLEQDEGRREQIMRRVEQARSDISLSTPEFESGTAEAIYGGLSSTVRQAPGLALSLLTRSPTPMLVTAGIQTEAEAYGKYRVRGGTPGQALLGGTLEGAIEMATEKIPLRTMLGAFGQPGRKALTEFAKSQLQEQVGEQVATLLQDAVDTAIANPDKTWGEYWAERPEAAYKTFVSTLVQSGVMTGAHYGVQKVAGRAQDDADAANQAERAAEAIEQLSQLATASKLNARDAVTFKGLVAEIADEKGEAPTEFTIDSTTLLNTLNQSGITPEQLAEVAPTVAEQLRNPTGDIRVPVSEFLAAGEQITAPFVDHLRVADDAMTRAEAREFLKEHGERIQADVETELQKHDEQATFRQSIESVRAEFEAELGKAGRFKPAVNKAYSELLANFYGATAARVGVTPQELLQKYRLRVQSTMPVGDRKLNQDDDPAAALMQMGRDESLYQYPKASGKGLAEIATAKQPALKVTQETITQQDNSETPTGNWEIVTERGDTAILTEKGNEVWINVAGLAPGREGSLIYDLAANYAFNNGKVFIGDPAGLSESAMVRRAENMLSSAIKYGTTDHIAPHPKQVAGSDKVPPLKWTPGDTLGNIRALMEVTTGINAESSGAGSGITYDAAADQFKDSEGNAFDGVDGLAVLADLDRESQGAGAPGQATLRRDALFRALLQGPDQRRAVLERLHRQSGDGGTGTGGALAGSFYQDEGVTPRAQIALPESFANSPAIIALFEGADLSSFIHESGHLFLEVQADLAARIAQQQAGGASLTPGEQGILDDTNKLLEWFGIKGSENQTPLDAWADMSLDEKRESHEKFARGFEAYTREGKAPSMALQDVFSRFRSWLMQVYKTLTQLNVDMNDDVRGVMNRMLATDYAIEEAEAARNMGPLFKSAEDAGRYGMSLEQYNALQSLGEQAKAAALAELDARSLKDMKWLSRARDKALKARQQEVDELRREIRNEVRAEVYAEPVYQAWAFLTGKKPVAQETEEQKAYRQAVRDRAERRDEYEDEAAKAVRADLLETSEEAQGLKGIQKGQFLARNKRQIGILVDQKMLDWDEAHPMPERPEEETLDDPLTVAVRLNTEELRKAYGTGETAIWRKLSANRMTSDKGLIPDIVADMIPGGGFDSGDHLVKALAAATPPQDVIDARTDQRMLEMFGDITSPEALQRAADEAVHNEMRARAIATEMKALAAATTVREDTGRKNAKGQSMSIDALAKAAKEYADAIISRLKVREIRPSQYAAAEARSAKLAEKALVAGKIEEAGQHKRNQLVNNRATKAAYDAREEIQSAQDYFRKFDKRSKTIDAGYLDQIEQLLERYDFRPTTLKEIDRRKSFTAWLEEQRAEGIEPNVPAELLDEASRKSFKDMTLEELRGLRETVEQMEHLGRLKNKLLLARDQRDFDAAAEEMALSIIQHGGKIREVKLEGPNPVTDWFAGVAAQHRKLASLFRQMDGNQDNGPMYDLIGRAMNERGTMEDVMNEKATMELQKLYAPLLKMRGGITGSRSKLFIPEINASLTRGGRLAVALNWGNEANRQRLLDGDKWTEGQVRAILKTLTPQELAFVNSTWAYLDSFWPEVAAKEKRLTGVEPEKVEALPFNVIAADGTEVAMRGGYYPLKYDTDRSDRADQQEAAQVAKEMMQGAFTRATTRRGHTKARLEEVKRAVRKDLNVITQHVTQVTHDLAWHEWLIDTNKLLGDDRVAGAIRDFHGPKVLKTIRDGVMGIATADVAPQTEIDKALIKLRSNVTRATMGASLTTAFLQPFGLTQSMVRIGPKHVLRGMARWGGEAVRMENTLSWVHEKSDFMRLRAKTFNKELREIRGSVAGKSKTMRVVDAGLFALMQKMQMVADVPTWVGQYEKSVAEGLDEQAAVAMADRMVLESQGGGQTKDLAEVQRKHPMLTQFYSYFSVTLNLAAEQTAATNFKNPAAVAGWLGDMALLMVIPAILPSFLMYALKGGDDDEEGLAKKLVEWQVGYLLGTVVGLRELSGAVGGFDYAGPPVGRLITDLGKAGKQASQGELDEPAVMAIVNLLGSAFGIPTVQATRSYKGWKAWDEGQEGAGPASVLFGPPPKK